jgi:preprotein translocase SecE subunit
VAAWRAPREMQLFAREEIFMADSVTPMQRAAGWPARLKEYVGELQMEMRRVTWPSWKQVRATTLVVIFAVFAFSAYFFVVDAVVNAGITKLIDTFTK